MATKKQIIYPVLALVVLGLGAYGLASMKKPPEEKKQEDVIPVVSVESVEISPLSLKVSSYGIVQPKYETRLVAQLSGEIVELSDEFIRGGLVSKGQMLARIDPNDYEAALIEAKANLATAQASLQLELAAGHVAKEEWSRIERDNPSELSLRKPQLAQEQARVRAAEAAVKRAERNMERTKIVAPYDALIDSRQIGLGSYVSTGTELGKLLAVNVAEIRLPIAEKELQFLRNEGMNAPVELTTERGGGLQTWQAQIVRNEGVVDNRSRMNYLVAEVIDPYGTLSDKDTLKFGDYVTAKIEGIEIAQATAVPSHLVVDGKIAVYSTDNKLTYKNVDVVRRDGRQVIVSGGLEQNDKIITSALDYPIEGMLLALPKTQSETRSDSESDAQLALKE